MFWRETAGGRMFEREKTRSGGRHLPIITWESEFEEAVVFLVGTLGKRRRLGKKPVVIHSLRVANRLVEGGYARPVVIAGILHDIMEKTKIPKARITRTFGREVTVLVEAVTNDARIKDPIKRYQDSVDRCSMLGNNALGIRIADLSDNVDRMLALGEVDRFHRLEIKLKLLLRRCEDCGLKGKEILGLKTRLKKLVAVRIS